MNNPLVSDSKISTGPDGHCRACPFPGVTFLFEVFDSLKDSGDPNLALLSVRTRDNTRRLYSALKHCAGMLWESLQHRQEAFRLPSSTFHVTLADAVHAGNVGRLDPEAQEMFRSLLSGLPQTFPQLEEALQDLRVLETLPRSISMEFGRLAIRQDALVAYLEPADRFSAEAISLLKQRRQQVDARLHQSIGKPESGPYEPHVSLCYFCSARAADEMADWVEQRSDRITEILVGTTVTFLGAAVYGFTDMVTFFRKNLVSHPHTER